MSAPRLASGRPRPDKETRELFSAGGVIFDEGGRVLLLRRSDEGTWCFPKGGIEPDETPKEAAAREIREECGLDCKIGRKVAESRYTFFWPPDDVNYDKRVVYFLATPIGGEIRLEELFDDARWVAAWAAPRMLYHRNDRRVLREAVKSRSRTRRP